MVEQLIYLHTNGATSLTSEATPKPCTVNRNYGLYTKTLPYCQVFLPNSVDGLGLEDCRHMILARDGVPNNPNEKDRHLLDDK